MPVKVGYFLATFSEKSGDFLIQGPGSTGDNSVLLIVIIVLIQSYESTFVFVTSFASKSININYAASFDIWESPWQIATREQLGNLDSSPRPAAKAIVTNTASIQSLGKRYALYCYVASPCNKKGFFCFAGWLSFSSWKVSRVHSV